MTFIAKLTLTHTRSDYGKMHEEKGVPYLELDSPIAYRGFPYANLNFIAFIFVSQN